MTRLRLWLIAVVLVAAGERAASADLPRFAAMLTDGTRLEGDTLSLDSPSNWRPQLSGRKLLEDDNPCLWLCDRRLRPAASPPEAFVETFTGDRLPGTVVGFRAAGDSLIDPAPPHLVVQVSFRLAGPSGGVQEEVRVTERYVRRIVWQRRPGSREPYTPGTLIYRDGRQIKFRAARFGADFVTLLLEEGGQRALFAEISELHLPARDPWDVYYEELAVLAPEGHGRLWQVEGTTGLIATGSFSRSALTAPGNPKDPDQWWILFQPAWSLDALRIPHSTLWMHRLFAPQQPPLSRLWPIEQVRPGALGESWSWQRNVSVRGEPLESGGKGHGWGFGVHAPSQLQFPLPAAARAFRSRLGLDHAAGSGGCVRVRVYVDATDKAPLYESPFIVGSATTEATGTLSLGEPGTEPRQLILQLDAAHQGRPPGADPLDIRDTFDWLDPVVELDEKLLAAEISRRLDWTVPAWNGWTMAPVELGRFHWKHLLVSPGGLKAGQFLHWVQAVDGPLVLSRRLAVGPNDHWLIVAAGQSTATKGPPRIEVRVDGQTAADFEVPVQGNPLAPDLPLLAFSLEPYRGHEIDIELVQTPGPEYAWIQWRSVVVSDRMPAVYPLFEDDGEFAALDPQVPGPATLVEDDRHSGRAAIKVPAGGRFQLTLPHPVHVRQQPFWGEYRYLRFAFRKVGQGRAALELDHLRSEQLLARYDAGTGELSHGAAKRVWLLELPNEWIVMTRDLYADFGELDITGLTLSALDGEYVLFDHVWLGRTEADLAQIPAAVSPEQTNQKARRELAREVLAKGLPATVAVETGGRIGTGTLIEGGWVLTAGHLLSGAGADVWIELSDGRRVKGTIGGISRELDTGVVRLADVIDIPPLVLSEEQDFPSGKLYVGIAHTSPRESKQPPQAHVVDVRRTFRESLWTDFRLEGAVTGGPLLDSQGRLIGLHTRVRDYDGFLYTKSHLVREQLERLKRGEVWGEWLPATGPMIGVIISTTRDGAKVTGVFPNSPAAQAELEVDDLVVKVDGKSVAGLDDVYRVLADKDPGYRLELEIQRRRAKLQKTLVLGPRIP